MDNKIVFYEEVRRNSNENIELLTKYDTCDKYDYLSAVACGVIGGIIDVFCVGSPNDSMLQSWTDTQVDKSVMSFAKLNGWSPREGNEKSIKSAIGFLEGQFKINYDQTSGVLGMSTKNHHFMSLAHSPSPVGLFFSILNQFTSTSSFVSNGHLITMNTDNFELLGGNLIAKIFCGISNWFGHLMSDIAGSSGASSRGTGIVIPFYELFGFCNFGKFNVGDNKQSLASIADQAFKKGYDARFGLTQSIPVIITNLSINLIWSIRQYFGYKRPLKECIPTSQNKNLRVMLLVGNATLCTIDAVDAGVRSGGNTLNFFMRINLIAWFRLFALVIKELCHVLGIERIFAAQILAIQRNHEAVLAYLKELEKIDIVAFKEETTKYNNMLQGLENTSNSENLNAFLLDVYEKNQLEKPWQGDFDSHMSDKNATLKFY